MGLKEVGRMMVLASALGAPGCLDTSKMSCAEIDHQITEVRESIRFPVAVSWEGLAVRQTGDEVRLKLLEDARIEKHCR